MAKIQERPLDPMSPEDEAKTADGAEDLINVLIHRKTRQPGEPRTPLAQKLAEQQEKEEVPAPMPPLTLPKPEIKEEVPEPVLKHEEPKTEPEKETKAAARIGLDFDGLVVAGEKLEEDYHLTAADYLKIRPVVGGKVISIEATPEQVEFTASGILISNPSIVVRIDNLGEPIDVLVDFADEDIPEEQPKKPVHRASASKPAPKAASKKPAPRTRAHSATRKPAAAKPEAHKESESEKKEPVEAPTPEIPTSSEPSAKSPF